MSLLAVIGFIIVVAVIGTCTQIIQNEGKIALSIELLIIAVIGLSFIIAYI